MKAFPREWYALVSTRANARDELNSFDLRKDNMNPETHIAAQEAWVEWGEAVRNARLTYTKEEQDGVLVVTLSSGEVYREDEPL